MKLELLPNEIFLDLFDYFNGTDLLRAFYHLNSRFNLLLYDQYRSYRFQFNSISKRDFDMICQQHLPFIANRVLALQLSDNRWTLEQTNLFCTYIPSFRHFTHLRSLTLFKLRSYQILLKLLNECQYLCSLIRLIIYSCSFVNSEADFQIIINKVWSLPKLSNCQVDIVIEEQLIFCVPTIISSSLQRVTIYNSKLKLNQLNRLLDYTPRLKYLSTSIESLVDNNYIASPLLTLIQLRVRSLFSVHMSNMIIFFQSMPNLRHLNITIRSELINGYQWEQIIRNYLPKLKIFRLRMRKLFLTGQNIQEQADELFKSFQSSFWIDQHRWFVRCVTQDRSISLYTASKEYFSYGIANLHSWRSTYPHDNQQEFYNNMTSIFDKTFFDQRISSDIRLPNIKYLYVKLPINDQFWSIVPNLNQLKTLAISFHANTFHSQVQTLLDRSPRLYTLRIIQDASLPLSMSFFKYTNASVRELDLEDCNHCLNEEECFMLARSSLGIQDEELSIQVNSRECIIHLVKNMMNLRVLNVKCANDEYLKQLALTEHNDEVIEWLKHRLPSTYSIVRESQIKSNIIIWM